MKKLIAVFMALIIISNVYGIQNNQIDGFNSQNRILNYKTYFSSDFNVLISSRNSLYKYNKVNSDNLELKISQFPANQFSKDIAVLDNMWAIGTQLGSGEAIIFENSSIIGKFSRGISHDRGSFISKNKFYTSNTYSGQLIDLESGKRYSIPLKGDFRPVLAKKDTDSDQEFELLVGDSSSKYFSFIDGPKVIWRSSSGSPRYSYIINNLQVVSSYNNRIESRFISNGSVKWSKSAKDPSPVVFGDKVVYWSDGFFYIRNISDGSLISKKEYANEVGLAVKHPKKDYFVAVEDTNLSFFSSNGEKLGSFEAGETNLKPQFTQYEDDSDYEIAYASDKTVSIYDYKLEKDSYNGSLENAAIIGDGKAALKAAAFNTTLFVSDSYSEVEKDVERSGLTPVGLEGVNNVESVDLKDYSKDKKYYTDSKEKAVYVAAFAAADNASLTFNKKDADKDFSNYTISELEDLFIDRFDPHHIAIVDLSSEKAPLASYIAVKQNILPVAPEYNTVISVDEKIESTFQKIGNNPNTIKNGRYVSLLEAPQNRTEDPVEKNSLFKDPGDGKYYYSDNLYADIDDDEFMDVRVGRYPESVSASSRLFHRSLVRRSEKHSLVASEYLHSHWPVVLGSFGGGLRYGSNVNSVLTREGFETTHLVEYRSKPVEFMMSLTPVEIIGFLDETDSVDHLVSEKVGDTAGIVAKNGLIVLRVMEYTEQLVKMHYEFEWNTFGFDLERSKQRVSSLSVPEETSFSGTIQKSVMEALYVAFWPDRFPQLNESSLKHEMKAKDIIYYQGVGSGDEWVLPNQPVSQFGILENRYTGRNNITSDEVPEIDHSIIYDTSDNAANGEMKTVFIQNGASAFIGYSSVNYPAVGNVADAKFFREGYTTGESYKKAVNSLIAPRLIYRPTSSHISGVREKMSESLQLYGNPEMKKDPIEQEYFEISRNCEERDCVLNIELNPSYRIKQHYNHSTAEFNASTWLVEPGVNITPLYYAEFEVPKGSKIEETSVETDYREIENLVRQKPVLLSHSQNVSNVSSNVSIKNSAIDISGNSVTVLQTGLKQNKVVENASFNIKYRAPVSVEIEKDGRSVFAQVYSETESDYNLIYTVDNQSSTLKVEDVTERKVELKDLEPGKYQIDVTIYNRSISTEDFETVVVAEEPEIYVFAPNSHVLEQRKVEAVLENPNSFPVTKTVELSLSKGVVPGLLETKSKTVRLGPNSKERVSWNIIPVNSGKHEISVSNSTARFNAKSAIKSRKSYGAQILGLFKGSYNAESNLEYSSSGSKIKIRTNNAVSQLKINSTHKSYSLETSDFRYQKTVSYKGQIETYTTQKGKLVKKTVSGTTTSSGNIPSRELREVEKTADQELQKILKIKNSLTQETVS